MALKGKLFMKDERRNEYNFTNSWKVFTIILFAYVIYKLVVLSKEVTYITVKADYLTKTEFEIDICYDLGLDKTTCKSIRDFNRKPEKVDFSCEFKELIGCYTKNFEDLKAREIIQKFKECELKNLTSVHENEIFKQTNLTYKLDDGHICVSHLFVVTDKEKEAKLKITSNEYKQNYHIFISFIRTYENRSDNDIYRSKRSQIFKRNCWLENGLNVCTESDKVFEFYFNLYSTRHLKYPFVTDCIDYMNSNGNYSTQIECYQNCLKNDRKKVDHLLTFDENNDILLDFNKTSSKILSDECSNKCSKADCNYLGFYLAYLSEEKSTNESTIMIKIDNKDRSSKAVPLASFLKIFWMFSAFFSIFFGINLYGLLLRSTNFPNVTKILQSYNLMSNRKRKNRARKQLMILSATTAIGLIIGLIIESVLFDFGKGDSIMFLRRDSIEERKVSISICFDLCKIIKNEAVFNNKENCTEDLLMNLTIDKLNEITFNVEDFKKIASMRNSARVYPIRDDEFDIPVFFRNLTKCFLLFYDAKNYWPHIPILRMSEVHVNITGINYKHFYVEDGENVSFPKFDSKPKTKSVLSYVKLNNLQRKCVNYNQTYACESKDDCIQKCIVNATTKNTQFPTGVNLIIEDNKVAKKYFGMKFFHDISNETEVCKKNYSEEECKFATTYLSATEILKENDSISVNLTPHISEKKDLENESKFIEFNRIISLVILFTGVSVKDFLNAFVQIYFRSLASIFDFRILKRFLYLFLFFLFCIHFGILFYKLVFHPMIEVASGHLLQHIDWPKIRICFEHEIDLTYDNITLGRLNSLTLNVSEFLEKIIVIDGEESIKIIYDDFIFDEKNLGWNYNSTKNANIRSRINVFYLKNLKCINFEVEMTDKMNMHIHSHMNNRKLDQLFRISVFLNKTMNKRAFVYLNKDYVFDFYNHKPMGAYYYNIFYTVLDNNYQDDFFVFKNFGSIIRNFFGLVTVLDDSQSYLLKLLADFMKEQFR